MDKLHCGRMSPRGKGCCVIPGSEAPGFLVVFILPSNVTLIETRSGTVLSMNSNLVNKKDAQMIMGV